MRTAWVEGAREDGFESSGGDGGIVIVRRAAEAMVESVATAMLVRSSMVSQSVWCWCTQDREAVVNPDRRNFGPTCTRHPEPTSHDPFGSKETSCKDHSPYLLHAGTVTNSKFARLTTGLFRPTLYYKRLSTLKDHQSTEQQPGIEAMVRQYQMPGRRSSAQDHENSRW